jgi:DNA adenine methylase
MLALELARMADFMRRFKGDVMVSVNDHPDIRRVFEGFHFRDSGYSLLHDQSAAGEV